MKQKEANAKDKNNVKVVCKYGQIESAAQIVHDSFRRFVQRELAKSCG